MPILISVSYQSNFHFSQWKIYLHFRSVKHLWVFPATAAHVPEPYRPTEWWRSGHVSSQTRGIQEESRRWVRNMFVIVIWYEKQAWQATATPSQPMRYDTHCRMVFSCLIFTGQHCSFLRSSSILALLLILLPLPVEMFPDGLITATSDWPTSIHIGRVHAPNTKDDYRFVWYSLFSGWNQRDSFAKFMGSNLKKNCLCNQFKI